MLFIVTLNLFGASGDQVEQKPVPGKRAGGERCC